MPTVTFVPDGRRVEVEAGVTIFEAARKGGVPLVAPCGGKGSCGRCSVTVEPTISCVAQADSFGAVNGRPVILPAVPHAWTVR